MTCLSDFINKEQNGASLKIMAVIYNNKFVIRLFFLILGFQTIYVIFFCSSRYEEEDNSKYVKAQHCGEIIHVTKPVKVIPTDNEEHKDTGNLDRLKDFRLGNTKKSLSGIMRNEFEYLSEFTAAYTDEELTQLYELLRIVDYVLTAEKIPYFMIGGTLLGSVRHHGPIPWDDDCDILIDNKYRDSLENILRAQPRLKVSFSGLRSKVYLVDSERTSHYEWSWPYVDLNYYTRNVTHMVLMNLNENLVLPNDIVEPLHRRPFGPLWLLAPRDSLQAVRLTIGSKLHVCIAESYSHRVELLRDRPPVRIPCRALVWRVPWVLRSPWRRAKKTGVLETLVFKNEAMQTLLIHEPSESIKYDNSDVFSFNKISYG